MVDPRPASGERPADPTKRWTAIQSSERRKRLLPTLFAMTFATGLIDAVSYIAIGGLFTANMTGNLVLLGFALAGTGGFSISRTLLSLVAFAIGSALGGRLARHWDERPFLWFRRTTAIEIGLLAVAALLTIGLPTGIHPPDSPRRYAVIAVLAITMGMRNATVRRLGFTDVPTTVSTSTISDLASDSWLGGGERRHEPRRVAAIATMLIGAVIGAVAVRASPLLALGAAELVLLAAALHQAWIDHRIPASSALPPPS